VSVTIQLSLQYDRSWPWGCGVLRIDRVQLQRACTPVTRLAHVGGDERNHTLCCVQTLDPAVTSEHLRCGEVAKSKHEFADEHFPLVAVVGTEQKLLRRYHCLMSWTPSTFAQAPALNTPQNFTPAFNTTTETSLHPHVRIIDVIASTGVRPTGV